MNNFTNFIEKSSDLLENATRGFLYAIFAKGEYICSTERRNIEKNARLKRNTLRSSNH